MQKIDPTPPHTEPAEELTIHDLWLMAKNVAGFLRSKWTYWLTFTLIGGAAGIAAAILWPHTYTATVSFAQEESKPTGAGLSGLASQFGIDIGGMLGGSSMFAGDNIIGLLQSRSMIREVLTSPYGENEGASLADVYAEAHKLKGKWNKKWNTNFEFRLSKDGKLPSLRHDSLLNVLIEKIVKEDFYVDRRDKKISFIDVKATFRDEQLAVLFVNRLVRNAGDFYIETKIKRLRQNVDRLQQRSDSIGRLLNAQSFVAAEKQSRILDINPAFQSGAVDAEIGVRNKFMLATIYTEVTKQLEAQKVILTQETPVIQLVDEAAMPLEKNKKSKAAYGLIGAILAFLLAIAFLIVKRFSATDPPTPHV